MEGTRMSEEVYEEQIESIEDQIKMAEEAMEEKLGVLWEMVDSRFDRLFDMWEGALGYEQIAERMRLFLGNEKPISFSLLKNVRDEVNGRLREIRESYDKDKKESDKIDWYEWLDQWCNRSNGEYDDAIEVVAELITLDMCQNVWEALRRIPEFEKAASEEIDKMRNEMSDIEE